MVLKGTPETQCMYFHVSLRHPEDSLIPAESLGEETASKSDRFGSRGQRALICHHRISEPRQHVTCTPPASLQQTPLSLQVNLLCNCNEPN